MTWLFWLLPVILTVVAVVMGLTPKGGRPVARTHMMGVARLVLLAMIIIFTYLAFRSR